MNEAQVPIFDVQQIVGHSDVKTTAIYYHASTKTMRKAINRDTLFLRDMTGEQKLAVIKQHLRELVEAFHLDEDKDLVTELVEKTDEVRLVVKKKLLQK